MSSDLLDSVDLARADKISVIIISIVRLIACVNADYHSPNLDHNFAPIVIWSETESNIAIVCGRTLYSRLDVLCSDTDTSLSSFLSAYPVPYPYGITYTKQAVRPLVLEAQRLNGARQGYQLESFR